MTKLGDRINKIKRSVDPEKGKTTYTIEDATKDPSLEAFRAPPPIKTSHKTVKIRLDVYDRLMKIIALHELDTVGRTINKIVSDWCDQHEG